MTLGNEDHAPRVTHDIEPETASTSSLRRDGRSDVMVKVQGLHKAYGQHDVLHGINFEVCRGEVVAIIGPSGSGKSTLIRCLNLLETPTEGRISVSGVLDYQSGDALKHSDFARLRLKIGMVFQSFNLFPMMTALQNVSFAQIHALGRSRAEADARSHDLLETVGLADREGFQPAQLSGGQQQRVAIARALALDPELMLFDEPTSAIDPELRVEVLRVMKNLAASGMTMLIVTHEMSFAAQVADRVVFMAEGRIEEEGPAKQVLKRPTNPRTQRFLTAVEGIFE